MELRLGAPIDGEGVEPAKSDHVVERNAQKRIDTALMELNRIKTGHDNGRDNAQRNHHGGEPGSKPSNGTMPTDFVHTHQRRLQNEEDDPARECRAMNPEKERSRNRGMEEIVVDGALEAGDYNRRQQQRHRKIKIAMHNAVADGQG